MYVVLVGPPATRKGAAMRFAKSLLEAHTNVRFAPNDTGGQRQGLIAAMTEIGKENADMDKQLSSLIMGDEFSPDSVASLIGGNPADAIASLNQVEFDTRDPRSMYIVAGELNSILGENNTQMLTFLQEMWDGVPYRYKLRNTQYEIKDGLLSILGGTTQGQIALSMPAEAIGQGFTSRVVFVFAGHRAGTIPRPTLDLDAGNEVGEIFSAVFNNFEGAFEESESAARLIDEIYMRGVVLKDPRFLHYVDRRGDHLKKLAMCLAAGRGYMTIEPQDVHLADQLLMFTEERMPDALGEYGMNRLGAAKQRLLDMVKSTVDPTPLPILLGLMSRDMNKLDFDNAIAELSNANKITLVTLPQLGHCVIAVPDTAAKRAKATLREISKLM